jgi:hypothetical protein
LENESLISHEFAIDQLNKIKKKINTGDYNGVITNSRSLVENVIITLYKDVTGIDLDTSKNLPEHWKQLSSVLNLDPKSIPNQYLKEITSGVITIIHGIGTISNKMSDRHSQTYTPSKRHAKLIANSALTIIDFIYEVIDYQMSRINDLVIRIDALNTNIHYKNEKQPSKENYERKKINEILKIKEVDDILFECDGFLKKMLLQHYIRDSVIGNYHQSANCFLKFKIFSEVLSQKELVQIKDKYKDNSQAQYDLEIFTSEVKAINQNIK